MNTNSTPGTSAVRVLPDVDPEAGLEPEHLWADPSARGFRIGLYLEHLEEGSFLHDQRLVLLDDSELTWLDIGKFEERLEAHLDALVLGDELALAVCRQQAQEGDAGELYAALCVFFRQRRQELVREALDSLDPADEERVSAAEDALCQEWPAEWHGELPQMATAGGALYPRLAARVAGFRRVGMSPAVQAALLQADDAALPTVAWALGRLRDPTTYRPLARLYSETQDPTLREAAARALLRMGDYQVVEHAAQRLQDEPYATVNLGLGGTRGHVRLLLDHLARGDADPGVLLALGLLGDLAAVEPLLRSLAHEELAGAAATALNLILGAELYEEVFVAEEVEEDELFEDEREQAAAGSAPPGGGSTRRLLSTDPAAWVAWLREHTASFQPLLRYRGGKPHSPAALLASLTSETSSRLIRQLACEELVIRYGLDFPFETEMWVVEQQQLLAGASWLAAGEVRPGGWYFAGRLLQA